MSTNTNLAIVIGVDTYKSIDFPNLPACKNDALAIKSVIENVKDWSEIVFINENASSREAKAKISDLVEKNKDKEVDELFFYFSGHGDRDNNDFFYIFSDFDQSKKESTGLRNSELDDLIKALSPKLCIKIIDACFSGTQYIKSATSSNKSIFEKSAQKSGLNDIYFLCSSRENEESLANHEYSIFTQSILTAILDHDGDIRYRDIMSYVADDLSNAGMPAPIFIIQASNTEKLGSITKETHKIINELFGIESNSAEASKIENQPKQEEGQDTPDASIYTKIATKSTELCFEENELKDFIDTFNEQMSKWNTEIEKIYEINIRLESHNAAHIPNTSKIGLWLEKNTEENYFAEPRFNERTYEEEEYKPLPRKPESIDRLNPHLESLGYFANRFLPKREIEYKLEKTTKTEKYIDGFNYTHWAENKILQLQLKPKFGIADPINAYTILIYSNKSMAIHFTYEFLKRLTWEDYSKPTCNNWRTIKVHIKSSSAAIQAANHIKKEIKTWLEIDLKKKLNKSH